MWGKKGVQDIVSKMDKNAIQELYLLPMRKIDTSEFMQIAKSLMENTSITVLYASGHYLEKEALVVMAEMIKMNKTLKSICIGNKDFGDEHMEILCDAVGQSCSIVHLDVENKGFGEIGMEALGQLKNIEVLKLGNNEITNGMLDAFNRSFEGKESKLQTLDLSRNSIASWNGMCEMVDGSKITEIDLASNKELGSMLVNERVVEKVLCGLSKINLHDCGLTEMQLVEMGKFIGMENCGLRDVDVSGNDVSKCLNVWMENLAMNTSIRQLNMAECGITDKNAHMIRSALNSCKVEMMDLSKNKLSGCGASALLAAPCLHELRLFGNQLHMDCTVFVENLKYCTKIQILDIGASELHGVKAAQVLNEVSQCSQLRTLVLGGNNLEQEGNQALQCLKENRPDLDVAIDKVDPNANAP